ncbi:rhodanese-related sulfurtransferase [Candidatus Saccharibacteria bacterium]|nr:rhodanese-related sulfurtransferase [Candidatus Saccharibacteria bacterium]
MQKIILYYKFTPISDPTMTMHWQRELCTRLNLKGRILISEHGINGTLGGDIENLREYKREMNRSVIFKDITYKWSDGGVEDFPKLKVKVKPEIVAFDAPNEINVTEKGIVNGGKHLKPHQVNKLVEERSDEVIFYDGRNAYEAKIGRFKNTIVPDVTTSRDFKKDIEEGEISKYKDRPIISYCTGGIRCEILSAMMLNRGYKEVYQIDGGIVKYGEKFGDDGLWEGKLFVFDDRMKMGFSDKSKDIAECENCGKKTSNMVNSTNVRRKLHVVCEECSTIVSAVDL